MATMATAATAEAAGSPVGEAAAAAEAAAEGRKPKAGDTRLAEVVVRVKRKRTDAANDTLLLPQKRARPTLEDAMAGLGIAKSEAAPSTSKKRGRVMLVCKRVERSDPETSEGAAAAEKQGLEGAEPGSSAKRRRFVDLEVSEEGLRQRMVTAGNEAELDFAVYHASTTGAMAMLRALLEKPGSDVNFQRRADGATALMAACSYCDLDFVRFLLERGADVSAQDQSGFDARARIGFCLAKPESQLLSSTMALLDKYEFVYDTYTIQQSVELGDDQGFYQPGATPGAVWSNAGLSTAWQDAPIAQFELDLDRIVGAGDDEIALAGDEASVHSSDLDNEDDENYRFNDYPDEEGEGGDSSHHAGSESDASGGSEGGGDSDGLDDDDDDDDDDEGGW